MGDFGRRFSWRARRRSQATRLVTIRVNWPAVVGPEWVQPCGYAHTPLTWLVVALGVVALELVVVQLFAAKFRVPLKCHVDALRLCPPNARFALEKPLVILPSFLHSSLFRFENRQGVTPRSLPLPLHSSPLLLLRPLSPLPRLHNRAGETKESLELGQSKFFGDPNAP